MIRVKRQKSEKVSFPKSEGTNSLAKAKGIDSRAVWGFEMLDSLPVEAGVPIQGCPIQLSQASQRSDDLLQLGGLKTK